MSDLQRWGPGIVGVHSFSRVADMVKYSDGDYILHADLVKIFAWMVEHEVMFYQRGFQWISDRRWQIEHVPDGDFLAAIVWMMGVE